MIEKLEAAIAAAKSKLGAEHDEYLDAKTKYEAAKARFDALDAIRATQSKVVTTLEKLTAELHDLRSKPKK